MEFGKTKGIVSSWNLSWIVLAVAVAGILLFQALPGPFFLDDSYITFRYARNISAGLGFVYNPQETVQGTTTPLYTLLLALFSRLFSAANIPLISFGIGLIADVLNTWILFRIARRLLQHDLAAFLLCLVFLLQPLRLNVARGGMETSLFITLLLSMYDRYLIGRKVFQAATLAALAILMRIDAILAIAPVLAHAFWNYKARAASATLVGTAVLIPWFAWAAWYFGNPLPHSILAKMAAYRAYNPGASLIFLLTFLGTGTVGPYQQILIIAPGLVLAIFLAIFGIRWITAGHQESLVIIAYPFLYYTVMTLQHAPLFFSWYYVPLMPGFLLLFFGAFHFLVRKGSAAQIKRAEVLMIGLSSIALVLFPAVLMRLLPGWADSRVIESLYRKTSAEIHDQIPNGSLVLAPDIGVVGWSLENVRILDPVGLVSPVSLKYMDQRGEMNLVSKQLVWELHPDYIIARDGFLQNFLLDQQFLTRYQLIKQESSGSTTAGVVLVFGRK